MHEVSPDIQEQVEAFHRRLRDSELLCREAAAALAVDQVMKQLQPTRPAPRRRSWLTLPSRVLGRAGRRLFSLALTKRTRCREIDQWGFSDSAPIIIDVCPNPVRHRSQGFRSSATSFAASPQRSQTGDRPSDWLLTGNANEERSSK